MIQSTVIQKIREWYQFLVVLGGFCFQNTKCGCQVTCKILPWWKWEKLILFVVLRSKMRDCHSLEIHLRVVVGFFVERLTANIFVFYLSKVLKEAKGAKRMFLTRI